MARWMVQKREREVSSVWLMKGALSESGNLMLIFGLC